MPLHFLIDDADAGVATAQPGEHVVLTGAEAHHAATVRRVRVGEPVTVGDGRGTWVTGECATVGSREVVVRVLARREIAAPAPRLVLAQALAKGDRDELAVQAATELGVDEIVPWQAARSVSRWDAAKAEKGRDRWAAIVREATKQAQRAWLAGVTPVQTTAMLARRAAASRVIVLDPTAPTRLQDAVGTAASRDVVLVVGPEGGIADHEFAEFEAAGAARAVLGDTVLRTSTAGPAAIAVASLTLGRW